MVLIIIKKDKDAFSIFEARTKNKKLERKGPRQSTIFSKQSKEDNVLDEQNARLLKQHVAISTRSTYLSNQIMSTIWFIDDYETYSLLK